MDGEYVVDKSNYKSMDKERLIKELARIEDLAVPVISRQAKIDFIKNEIALRYLKVN
jgi:hypothetical protein